MPDPTPSQLLQQISALRNEIEELREEIGSHTGTEAGASGPLYPHPRQQIAVAEYGTGQMRLDQTGTQIVNSNQSQGTYFLSKFSDAPVNESKAASLIGYTDPTNDYAYITLEALGTVDDLILRIRSDVANAFGGSVFLFDGAPIWLLGVTSDSTTLSDGFLWYRSDTDKFRARINGATENLATESYVGTVTLGTLGAYKDADQEVTDTTLAADSELSVSLAASSKYQFSIDVFFLNDGATEGYKVALSGTVGIQDLKAQAVIYDDTLNTIVGFARITAIDTAVGATLSSGSNYARIEGAIETTTAGTFLVKFAQNATGASAGVHHEIGCSMQVVRVE